jgi:hypothetical protein
MPELSLDDDQRNALVRHLDRVGVPELVWCEASPHSRCRCCSAELLASGGLVPVPTRSGPVNDTQQRANGQLAPDVHP